MPRRSGLTRSQQMSRIRGANTSPERMVARALWAAGLRYRLRFSRLAGRPDIVFSRARVVVFVDGCFWHGCPDHYVRPRSRSVFWRRKLRENVTRDRRQTAVLEELGWSVLRFWEHTVFTAPEKVTARIRQAIANGSLADRSYAWRVLTAIPLDRRGLWERRTLIGLRNDERRIIVIRRHTRKWRRTTADAAVAQTASYIPR